MPFINLIEEQRLAKRQAGSKARTGLIAFVATTSLALATCGYFLLQAESLDQEATRLRNEAAKNEPIQKEIDLAKSALNSMNPRLATLESAHEVTTKWETILNHLTVQTPREMWLTSIRCVASDPSKPIDVSFQGVASRLDNVGEFILRMQGCEQLENVALKFTQEKVLANSVGIEFDVTSQVAGTAEAVAKDEEKEGEEAKQ